MNREEEKKGKKGSVEVEARTVEEAITKGLAQLGKNREEVEIEIWRDGKIIKVKVKLGEMSG